MKNLTTIAIFLIATLTISAQKINKNPDWKVGEDVVQYEHSVKRLEGENVKGSITNISYKTQKQLITQTNDGKLRGDAKKKQLKQIKDYSAGGLIALYFNRENEASVNLGNYTITVKDAADKEVFKKSYKDKAGKVDSENGGWYNSSSLRVKEKVHPPFFIEINDGKTLYKFNVLN